MNSLPRLSQTSQLKFGCTPHVPCFNLCCRDLNLALSPYDVLRLRTALKIDSKTFIQNYGALTQLPGNQFPALMLKMSKAADAPCPFVGPSGCGVYPHRPGACRTYPLGRGASINDNGDIQEVYVLVREDHCLGFESSATQTVAEYLQTQGMVRYIWFDNLYLKLMHHVSRQGGPLSKSNFSKVFIGVYRPDILESVLEGTCLPPLDGLVDTPLDMTAEEIILVQAMTWLQKPLKVSPDK